MGLQWDKPSINWCRISSIHSILYLFVVFLSLSKHFPWQGFLSRLNPPSLYPTPSPPLFFIFVSFSSFSTFGWAQLCPRRLAQHRLGFAHLAVISMILSILLDPLAFVPKTFYTHAASSFYIFWPFPTSLKLWSELRSVKTQNAKRAFRNARSKRRGDL